jgi:Ca-activated chloride channel family protein
MPATVEKSAEVASTPTPTPKLDEGKLGKTTDVGTAHAVSKLVGLKGVSPIALGATKDEAKVGNAFGMGGLGMIGSGRGGGGGGGGNANFNGSNAVGVLAGKNGYTMGAGAHATYGAAYGGVASYSYGVVRTRQPSQPRYSRPTHVQPEKAEPEGNSDEVQEKLTPNGWTETVADHLSTFGADVDTASYTESRRAIREGRLPNADVVRPEEFINYFRYDYTAPPEASFAVYSDMAPSPFEPDVQLLRVGVQAHRVAAKERKVMHLTFLVDVSGSMNAPDRFPLAQECLRILLGNLSDHDTVALVTYAGGVSDVLPPTPVSQREKILAAINSLRVMGGTDMGSGMEIAYKHAAHELRPNEVSRVIVLTDGDANIGHTTHEAILKSIESYVKEGVTLSTIGFGTGNYRDGMLEQLADKGNGNNYYIDDLKQAHRVFEEQLTGMLQIVAKDLKLQVDFNPDAVRRYKLIGYENRDIADKDFRNDRVDSGDVGAGHTVTALYALQLTHVGDKIGTVRVRAKPPNGEEASEQAFPVTSEQSHKSFEDAPKSFRLAVVAAGFADVLRGNANATYDQLESAAEHCDSDNADVRELRGLIRAAHKLSAKVE